MVSDKSKDNYKLKNSYTNKLGFKIKNYVICYNDSDKKKYIQEEITKSCFKIYDKIKN